MRQFTLFALVLALSAAAADPDPAALKAPPGYVLTLFQGGVKGARSLAHAPDGTVFVGTRGKKVYAIRGGKLIEVAADLDTPNGIAFRDGALYVGEPKRILKYENIVAALAKDPPAPPKPVVIFAGLPVDGGHDWRYMRFAPDGSLYIAIGAPCNLCNREKDEPRYSTIMRFAKLDGSAPEIYARGIRNSVGFDWHPKTAALWFTENGRDWLGPHVAALGMRFLNANTALIALHGSWNRSKPSGYQVVRVAFGPDRPQVDVFIDGFRSADGKVRGRPVDLDVQPDGSILISDDHANAIYRLARAPKG